jgi:hypothetical protein
MSVATKTRILATCCAVSNQWGVAHVTSLRGHLAGKLKCSACDQQYTVDFEEHEPLRISDFEERLRGAAQFAIDGSHPEHGNYVTVSEI